MREHIKKEIERLEKEMNGAADKLRLCFAIHRLKMVEMELDRFEATEIKPVVCDFAAERGGDTGFKRVMAQFQGA